MALTTASASAAKIRPFKEIFGSPTPPSFAKPLSLAVDQSVSPSPTAGDVLAIDSGSNEKQLVEVIAEAGFYKLSFSGQTTGWTGSGTIACNGSASKTITGVSNSTGALVAREGIRSTPASCIKPNTTINSITGTSPNITITLSQATEINANSGVVSLASDLTIKSATTALTAAQITSQIKEALEKLPNLGVGNIAVSGTGTASPFKREVEFKSTLAGIDVAALTCDGSSLTPLGSSCSVAPGLSTAVRYGIKRFNPDGTPANFSALGTNIIDGRKGAGGNTCGAEPSSCDETPQNSLSFAPASEMQVAIDNSGGPTNGDIYLTQAAAGLIDVFASDGHYLGQLTKYKEGPLGEGAEEAFGEVCGVSADPAGALYVGDYEVAGIPFSNGVVHKFTSLGAPHNPLATSDNTANFGTENPCYVAAGASFTAGFIFVNKGQGAIKKLDGTTGAEKYTVAPGVNNMVAVNPADGHVLAASGSVVTEYDASGPTEATLTSTLTAANTVQGVAVDKATGNVYISRVGNLNLEVYGPPADAPIVIAKSASGVTGTTATLNGTVNPQFGAIEECKFEYLTAAAYAAAGNSFNGTGANAPAPAPCAGSIPIDSSPHAVSAAVGGLTPNGTTYYFRLTAKNLVTTISSAPRTFATVKTAITETATAIGATTATLNGTLRNEEGNPFTACVFEYLTEAEYAENDAENGGSYSGPNVPLTKPCTPSVASIATDFEPHPVSAALTGLAQNTAYHFRIVATNSASGAVRGEDRQLSTLGPPQVLEEFAGPVGKTTAALNALLNPSGFATTYHFEWGPCVTSSTCSTSPYGNQAPDFDPFAGSGASPVRVTASLTGLQESAAYHFRLIATNHCNTALPSELCTTTGAGGEFTTLNDAGLPDNRGYELVSPPDKAPQGLVETQVSNGSFFQAAEDGQSVLFPLFGIEGADSGGDATYLAGRSPSGWRSTKVSPPSLVPNPVAGLIGDASAGIVTQYSPDLSCGIVYTFNPLTDDTPVADLELGTYNLYVRHADGTYTLITDTVPSNPEIPPIISVHITKVAGASPDCGRVYFQTRYDYLPDASGLYEWDHGTLRDAGRLPDGALPAGAVGAGGEIGLNGGSRMNSVSRDGSRFFFSALSDEAATVGRQAVFVREDGGATVVEASRKQGGGQDSLGARYEVASPDGSHVFFLATYGLTPAASSGPAQNCSNQQPGTLQACDLYDYDVDTGHLTDLSADSNPADPNGAVVQGVIAVSDDGSSVYFAARGRLVPGKGSSYAENTSGAGSANVYLARAGQLSYVATIAAQEMHQTSGHLLIRDLIWTADATPDGEHLLFASSAKVTGYDSGGVAEAYLYSAGPGTVACLSCRTDGEFPVGGPQASPLGESFRRNPPEVTARNYKISDDGSRVFFTMRDALAAGAVEGNENIYEWERGQVYLLLSAEPGEGGLAGASRSGDDVFLRTSRRLTAHDSDTVMDLYDVRVDGGFPPPPAPAVPCDPAADQCQGPPAAQPPASSPAGAGFSGPGNPGGTRDCRRPARQAHRLGSRAKRLRRAAARSSNPKRARVLRRRARSLAAAAEKRSGAAESCTRANRRAAK